MASIKDELKQEDEVRESVAMARLFHKTLEDGQP
jgi:hypothetical protein